MQELNKFLRSNRVLLCEQQLVTVPEAIWCFCIRYLEDKESKDKTDSKIDYKSVLSPEQFADFAILRSNRKKIAEENAIPAYAIFTNKELADIVLAECSSPAELLKVEGIGKKKAEKYGQQILVGLEKQLKA